MGTVHAANARAMPPFHPSAIQAVEALRAQFPNTPFLTLGQTVLWDEPTKAAFCRILESVAPGAQMVAAVHDTDYFAKLSGVENTGQKFVMLEHNDGDTRGLWSAAGEVSCVFGSETVPTRHALSEGGVAVERVAKTYPGGLDALLNEETNAWGWRALVHTEPRPLIAGDVKLRDIMPALKQQLQWAFGQSLGIVNEQEPNALVAQQIENWVEEYGAQNADGTLSGLYQWLTPRLWSLVGGQDFGLQTGASLQLFEFNKATCQRPRFGFLDAFLQPATRDLARQCYDDAVRGSGIYPLDQFGPGAIPFDVVIPGKGRGTLRIHNQSIFIQTEEPITLCTGCDCQSVEDLAQALESKFGPNVALVGKAVALISMLAAEYIFVFHEKASSYTSRTTKMNQAMRQGGIALVLHPMLRVKYETWDALQSAQAIFHLPPHLATAFGKAEIGSGEFGARWREVCDEQDRLRAGLKGCRSTRDLLALLAEWRGEAWAHVPQEYASARAVILDLRAQTEVLEAKVNELRSSARRDLMQAALLERDKGNDFRARVQPLRTRLFDVKESAWQRLTAVAPDGKPIKSTREEKTALAAQQEREAEEIADLRAQISQREAERRQFDEQIFALRQQAREAKASARDCIAQRVEMERSDEAVAARQTIARIEAEAELARLRYVRDALFVCEGLRYTNLRPTAWWFPLVSPDGAWFDALVQTMQARLEEL